MSIKPRKTPTSSMPHRNESTPLTRTKNPNKIKGSIQKPTSPKSKVMEPPKKDIITTPNHKPTIVQGNMWKPPPNAKILKRDQPQEKIVSQEPIKIDLVSKLSNMMVSISLKKLVKIIFVKAQVMEFLGLKVEKK